MSQAYISQIEIFGFGFAPKGWAVCAGQLMAINQNQALFSLLGTTYGGDGVTTFGLPDLRGRVPVGWGQGPGLSNYDLGQVGGAESLTLLQNQVPTHNHLINADAATTTGLVNAPSASVTLGRSSGSAPSGAFAINIYSTDSPATVLGTAAVAGAGGSQPHPNLMPTLCLNFCICLVGIFPSRN